MQISLMCNLPSATDATSLYRGMGPLQTLKRAMGGELVLDVGPTVSWATLKGCSAVFLQRPATDDHVRIMDMAKANNKPVWIDYDDWLYGVPQSNKASRLYNSPGIQNNMSKLIAKADIISVSTPYLAGMIRSILERIAKGSPGGKDLVLDPGKIVVVPNAYDNDLMTDLSNFEKREGQQHKLVSWRGSGTHDKDLLGVTDALASCVSDNRQWTYNFIGEPFWLSMEILDKAAGEGSTNIQVLETIDPINYLEVLALTKPAIMIVPLDDCPFNRSKSNIAWIEATHAGAVTLAPDFEEWRRPGIINYRTASEFGDLLAAFQRGEIDGNSHWRSSAKYIRENLLLKYVNETRERIIRALVGGKR